MKTELCLFSGAKIYPGHGRRYVPTVSVQSTRPVFIFANSKALALFNQRKNPRKISWTQLFRRMHKKGDQNETTTRRRARRAAKVQRAYVGASLEVIKAKRQQKTHAEIRAKSTALALKEVKAKKAKKAGKR